MKYLETNAVRKYASLMGNDGFISDKCTSILSLLELISGIKDNDSFQLRRSIIKKVVKSKIKIDINLPESIIYQAFGINFNNVGLSTEIGKIVNLVVLTKNYDSFLNTIQLNSLTEGWSFVKEYDNNASAGFKKSIIQHFSDSDIKQLITQFKERWTYENIEKLKELLVNYHASKLLNNPNIECNKSISEVISAYDNSIDIF